MADSDPLAHFGYFAEQLSRRGHADLHVLEGDMTVKVATLDYRDLRWRSDGPYLANNAFDLVRAQAAVRSGAMDLVAFGAPFVGARAVHRRPAALRHRSHAGR
jgi:N-ethylmaleimide reductase